MLTSFLIDKSMRLGNNECPACRTHCASRRSLRDDPNYDALIATLYPDIDKYEEEELAFHEEENARNKQIQASISQTFRRQAEALGKKRTSARVTAAAFVRRQGNYRNLRGRRNRTADHQGSDEEDGSNGNDGSKDSSSADERSPDIKSKRYKRRRGARTSQTSGANADGGSDDNNSETNRELLSASAGIIGGTEVFAWGRGGMCSNGRHGGHCWDNIKLSRNNRLSKLVDHLQSSKENEEVVAIVCAFEGVDSVDLELMNLGTSIHRNKLIAYFVLNVKFKSLKVSLTLVSLLEDKMPSLKRPYLCCSPRSSIRHLCQYVAMQTSTETSEIEILIIKDFHPVNNSSSIKNEPGILNACHNELQLLNENQTLGEIHGSFTQQNLVIAYRQKVQGAYVAADFPSSESLSFAGLISSKEKKEDQEEFQFSCSNVGSMIVSPNNCSPGKSISNYQQATTIRSSRHRASKRVPLESFLQIPRNRRESDVKQPNHQSSSRKQVSQAKRRANEKQSAGDKSFSLKLLSSFATPCRDCRSSQPTQSIKQHTSHISR
ncbi:hypothetical protein SASPL_121382 [Salvia splendens]|uniref:Uncharacterized protein n=1 Tax=Salvia splendens TaxID=180675 RepID=A0A8X8XSA9_SALSN|nr:hypothetical protein SASPL_121382 [Salvia splendens]